MKQLHVHAIPAFKDNYIWMMHDGSNAVVDPGDSEPVERTLAQIGLSLCALRPLLGCAGVAPALVRAGVRAGSL